MHRVLTECYPDHEPTVSRILADRLSVMFMVFAVGAFFDFEQPLIPPEAEDFYILARATLCIRPVYDYPTVYAIQSMVHALCGGIGRGTRQANLYIFLDIDDVVSNTRRPSHICLPTPVVGRATYHM